MDENIFLQECAKEISGNGKEAVTNTFNWLKEKGFNEKFYYFKEAKTPQAMGYKSVKLMQDIVERDSPELRTKLGIKCFPECLE